MTKERIEEIREQSKYDCYACGDIIYVRELLEEIDRLRNKLGIAIANIEDFKETLHFDFCCRMYEEGSDMHGDHCHDLDKLIKKLQG